MRVKLIFADLRILPDHCYALRKADCPPPRLPVRNPYIDLIDNMPLFSTSPISNKDYEPSHALEAADLSSAVQPHVVHELEEFTAHQKVILYSGMYACMCVWARARGRLLYISVYLYLLNEFHMISCIYMHLLTYYTIFILLNRARALQSAP